MAKVKMHSLLQCGFDSTLHYRASPAFCETFSLASLPFSWCMYLCQLSLLLNAGEGQYSLKYGEVGTRVAIVSSEPITGSSDWVSVPRNTALIISQGKSGYVSILKSPLASSGKHPRQEEVLRCLEAVTSAAEVEGHALALSRHKRRRIAQSHGECPYLSLQRYVYCI